MRGLPIVQLKLAISKIRQEGAPSGFSHRKTEIEVLQNMSASTSLPQVNNLKSMGRIRRLCSRVSVIIKCSLWRSQATPEDNVHFAMSNVLIAPLQVPSELLQLSRIVSEANPQFVMEIGTFSGGTLFVLARACKRNATIVSLDIGATNFLRKSMLKTFAINGGKIIPLTADSHAPETHRRVRDVLGSNQLDLLFIDGDHSYEGVKRDFDLYAPLVRRGGIVAFHNIAEHPVPSQCEVSQFWHEVKGGYNTRRSSRTTNRVGRGSAYCTFEFSSKLLCVLTLFCGFDMDCGGAAERNGFFQRFPAGNRFIGSLVDTKR